MKGITSTANLHDGGGGADLDGIAQRRAGAVHLQAAHVVRRQVAGLQRRADDILLRRAVGCRQAAGAAVLQGSRNTKCECQSCITSRSSSKQHCGCKNEFGDLGERRLGH